MASPGEGGSRVAKRDSYYGSKLVIVIFILSFSAIIITVASLETHSACLCYTQVEELTITNVTFGSMPGQVIFWLHNAGPMNVTIVQVFQGSSGYRNPTVFTDIMIHPASNLTATITFANMTFQTGRHYDFGLVSARGDTFPTSGTP